MTMGIPRFFIDLIGTIITWNNCFNHGDDGNDSTPAQSTDPAISYRETYILPHLNTERKIDKVIARIVSPVLSKLPKGDK
jgi:hypothetical protein